MEELSGSRSHKITLNNRKNCTVNGVKDVLSFDIHEVLLDTEAGILLIKGNNLHVSRLTLEKGEVDLDGQVDSLTYTGNGSDPKGKNAWLSRLFS